MISLRFCAIDRQLSIRMPWDILHSNPPAWAGIHRAVRRCISQRRCVSPHHICEKARWRWKIL